MRRKRAVSPKSLASLVVVFLDLWLVFCWRVAKKPCTYAKELHRQSAWQVVGVFIRLFGVCTGLFGELTSSAVDMGIDCIDKVFGNTKSLSRIHTALCRIDWALLRIDRALLRIDRALLRIDRDLRALLRFVICGTKTT